MPTVQEILKQSGMTDEQIKALDAKVMSGFSSVLTTAETAAQAAARAKEDAERTMRAQQDVLAKEINPALDAWATEKANLEANLAFYKTQNEQARAGGFVPQDAPGYKPTASSPAQGPDGRFVAGANPVPGSPQYMTIQDGYKALTNTTYIINEHMRLFGTPVPDEIENLVKEATEQHFDLRAWAERKYNFAGKRKEIEDKRQKEHDEKIRAEAIAERDKFHAERSASNPNLAPAEASRFATLNKAVASGQAKDPLSMSQTERHQATRQMVQRDIAERETVQ